MRMRESIGNRHGDANRAAARRFFALPVGSSTAVSSYAYVYSYYYAELAMLEVKASSDMI
jgi:hypothetical protein